MNICAFRNAIMKIHEGLLQLHEHKKILKTKIGKIILEEILVESWKDIQNIVLEYKKVYEYLQKTQFYQLHDNKLALQYLHKNLPFVLVPSLFTDFLIQFLHKPFALQFIYNLKFSVEHKNICKKLFSTI